MATRGIRRSVRPLTAEEIEAIPAQLGVFEIVDSDSQVVWIGQAGGLEPFGLRSALATAAERHPSAGFRHECTHGYRTRWLELLMLHRAEHGRLPAGNEADAHRIGRLR